MKKNSNIFENRRSLDLWYNPLMNTYAGLKRLELASKAISFIHHRYKTKNNEKNQPNANANQ